jgi:hypothetical protein
MSHETCHIGCPLILHSFICSCLMLLQSPSSFAYPAKLPRPARGFRRKSSMTYSSCAARKNAKGDPEVF